MRRGYTTGAAASGPDALDSFRALVLEGTLEGLGHPRHDRDERVQPDGHSGGVHLVSTMHAERCFSG